MGVRSRSATRTRHLTEIASPALYKSRRHGAPREPVGSRFRLGKDGRNLPRHWPSGRNSGLMIVSTLTSDEESAWDAFVRRSESATFFHLSGWRRVIEGAFGHKTFYLLARRNTEICGILPLTYVKSLLFGSSLISNAYCVRGGIIPNDSAARDALEREAFRLACDLSVGWIEYRDAASVADSISRNGIYANFRRPIERDDAANLKAIPRKQRAVLRKAIVTGLRAEIDPDPNRLHDIYARSVRRLGSPVFPRRYFQLLKNTFGEACDVITVLHEGRALASVMNFYFRDEVLPYYGGGIE